MKKHAVWGWDTSVQPNPLELDRADTPAEITGIKDEWRKVYPGMKFQLILNAKPESLPVDTKWQ